jgi:hypothetical protein
VSEILSHISYSKRFLSDGSYTFLVNDASQLVTKIHDEETMKVSAHDQSTPPILLQSDSTRSGPIRTALQVAVEAFQEVHPKHLVPWFFAKPETVDQSEYFRQLIEWKVRFFALFIEQSSLLNRINSK